MKKPKSLLSADRSVVKKEVQSNDSGDIEECAIDEEKSVNEREVQGEGEDGGQLWFLLKSGGGRNQQAHDPCCLCEFWLPHDVHRYGRYLGGAIRGAASSERTADDDKDDGGRHAAHHTEGGGQPRTGRGLLRGAYSQYAR